MATAPDASGRHMKKHNILLMDGAARPRAKSPLWFWATLGVLFMVALAPASQASIVTFNYDQVISGSGLVPGPNPWLTATFNDGGSSGAVTLTMSTSGLVGSQNVSGMYFNIDPTLNASLSNLSFTYLSGSSSGPAASSVSVGNNAFKADGDGRYDILFSFPTGSGFNANETVTYQITGIPSLTAQSFNYLSACGSPSCTGPGNFYAAAHVQNTGGSGSEWVGSNVGSVTAVPEANIWALMSVGLGALALRFRRRRA